MVLTGDYPVCGTLCRSKRRRCRCIFRVSLVESMGRICMATPLGSRRVGALGVWQFVEGELIGTKFPALQIKV